VPDDVSMTPLSDLRWHWGEAYLIRRQQCQRSMTTVPLRIALSSRIVHQSCARGTSVVAPAILTWAKTA
jgi:hypothetical protein